ncbi:MAG: TIGR01212 family radical SAM protein [Candidatus Dadabacteria bacterium]|nr:TIGR01212 family radical SAM protein [Candidatus Dadabacteria bacterium]NIQ16841.1 TIGR01212 family radical SAM protein [Candidatus Dadabacteria bacterium]
MNDRYNSYHKYLRERFGERVHKVSVDMGFTCPNRDGTVAQGGCVYCNNDSFVPPYARSRYSMDFQIKNGIEYLRERFKANKFIIYFQAYTSTYGDVKELERMYKEALKYDGVIGLAVGTRSDCVDEQKLELFEKLAKDYYVTIEYGIESIYDKTLEFMNRGHDYQSVLDAIDLTKGRGVEIGTHIIVGMPTETIDQMLSMAGEVSKLGINTFKIHNLHIIKNTQLERIYRKKPFYLFSYEEYLDFIVKFLERLSSDIMLERLFTDTPQDLLVAPKWTQRHNEIIYGIRQHLVKMDTYQGKKYTN